jgi:MFS family permease
MTNARVLRDRLINAGHFIDHMMMLIYTTAVIAMAAELGHSYGELIALATPGFVLFGALSLPFGWLGDRYGRHRLMVAFFVGIGIAAIATGLARDAWEISLGLTAIGAAAAIYHPAGIPMLVRGLARPGRAIGLNGVFGNLGVAAAPLVAGLLIAAASWRAAFIAPGLVSIGFGIAFWRLVERDTPPMRASAARASPFAGFEAGWRQVLVVITIVTLIGGIIFNATTVVLPKLLEERPVFAGADIVGYAALASFIYAAASLAQIASGRALDHVSAKWLLAGLVATQAITMSALSLASGPAVFALSLAMMLAVFGQIPVIDTIVTRYVPDHFRGRVFSLKYLLNLTVGAAAMPMIAVTHSSSGGFATLFAVLGAGAVVMSVVVVGLLRQPPATAGAGARAAAGGG